MDDFEWGVMVGRIEMAAFHHFDVVHTGWVPQADLHAWVEEAYSKEWADQIFPLEEEGG